MTEPSVDTHSLLQHRDFIRRVASGVLACPSAIDDVEQETLRKALEQPPRTGSARSFLARIARNLSLNRRRDEGRRTRREAAGSSPEAVPSTVEQVERLDLARRLVGAVASLPGAQREAVLLRYYEQRPPREIAAALGVPVETVRTRIKTGLAALRRRLDAEDGATRSALALLVARWGPELPGGALGGLPAWGSGLAAAGLVAAVTWIGVSCTTGGSGTGAQTPTQEAGDGSGAVDLESLPLEAIGYVEDGSAPSGAPGADPRSELRSQLQSLGYVGEEIDEGARDEDVAGDDGSSPQR